MNLSHGKILDKLIRNSMIKHRKRPGFVMKELPPEATSTAKRTAIRFIAKGTYWEPAPSSSLSAAGLVAEIFFNARPIMKVADPSNTTDNYLADLLQSNPTIALPYFKSVYFETRYPAAIKHFKAMNELPKKRGTTLERISRYEVKVSALRVVQEFEEKIPLWTRELETIYERELDIKRIINELRFAKVGTRGRAPQ